MKANIKLTALFFLTLSINVWGIEVGKYISGGWGDPAQNGHGYSIEVMNDDLAIVFWYTYNPDGTSTFLLTVGHIDGNTISGRTFYFSGMKFGEFDPAVLQEDVWGTVTVTFQDCNSATLQYSSTMSHKGVPFGSGTVQLQRLISLKGMNCTDSPFAGNYHATGIGPGVISTGAGVMFENGVLYFLARGTNSAEIGSALLTQTGPNTFSWDGVAFSVFGGATPFSGNGLITELGFEGSGPNNQKVFATRIENFQRQLSLLQIAGSYGISDGFTEEQRGAITISDSGNVSGTTLTGCNLIGQVIVPNSSFNQLFFDIDQTNCATQVKILAAGFFIFEENKIFAIGADGTFGYFWEMQPQN